MLEHSIKIYEIMKKFFVITIFVLMCVSSIAQNLLFMGIDTEQSYISFNRNISSKLTFQSESDTYAAYSGTFAGLSDCWITVTKSFSNTVHNIHVVCRGLSSDVINRMIASYTEKYGRVYKTYQKSVNKGKDVATYYDYKVGLHKIEIEVIYYVSGGSYFGIKYLPRGFANENSNVRVNKGDI